MIRAVIFCFALITLISSVFAEIMTTRPCRESVQCEVKQVTINGCQMAQEVCKLKKGKNATVTLDYKPEFSAEKLKARAFWANGFIDLPLAGMETDACLTTSCPVQKAVDQKYTFDLLISKNFPNGAYDVKWKLFNGDVEDELCCVIFKIKLMR